MKKVELVIIGFLGASNGFGVWKAGHTMQGPPPTESAKTKCQPSPALFILKMNSWGTSTTMAEVLSFFLGKLGKRRNELSKEGTRAPMIGSAPMEMGFIP